jgi:hypothetical protein
MRVRAGVVIALLSLCGGCGFGSSGAIEAAGSWERLPDPPLEPREQATGVWTGREVLILGGSDAPPTPPNASGASDARPLALRDGAAFDPHTRSWRRIAPAPIGIEPVSPTAVVRGVLYVAVARTPGRRDTRMDLLAYRARSDRWDRLPAPPRRNYTLAGAGGRLVAYGPARGPVRPSVFLLARGARRWIELPAPPIRGELVWSGRRLVVIGYDPAARDYRNPPLARAATLRLGDDAWRRLPDSEHVLRGYGPWLRVGRRLVNPGLGSGGVDYDFGRPNGGILDPERGIWSELPNVPEPAEDGGTEFGTGVLTRTRLLGGRPTMLVLDLTRGEWIRVQRLWSDRTAPQGWTAANTRRKLLAFGGARFDRRHPEGELLNDAWLWTPPSP